MLCTVTLTGGETQACPAARTCRAAVATGACRLDHVAYEHGNESRHHTYDKVAMVTSDLILFKIILFIILNFLLLSVSDMKHSPRDNSLTIHGR